MRKQIYSTKLKDLIIRINTAVLSLLSMHEFLYKSNIKSFSLSLMLQVTINSLSRRPFDYGTAHYFSFLSYVNQKFILLKFLAIGACSLLRDARKESKFHFVWLQTFTDGYNFPH